MPKKLQNKSKYAKYDTNKDGILDDIEVQQITAIDLHEDEVRKHLAQLRMARFTLVAMGVFTLAMFFVPLDRVNALSDISNLFYITGGSIVIGYMGITKLVGK